MGTVPIPLLSTGAARIGIRIISELGASDEWFISTSDTKSQAVKYFQRNWSLELDTGAAL